MGDYWRVIPMLDADSMASRPLPDKCFEKARLSLILTGATRLKKSESQ
jgi:hypothetical protein